VKRPRFRSYFQLGLGPAKYFQSVSSSLCSKGANSALPAWAGALEVLGGLDAPLWRGIRVGTQAAYTWGDGVLDCESSGTASGGAPYRYPFFDPGFAIRLVGSFTSS
jgi:hypothetical protein